MNQDEREGLVAYLIDRVEDLVRKAGNASTASAAAHIAEAQELLAIRANILKRRQSANDDVQLSLPLERAA